MGVASSTKNAMTSIQEQEIIGFWDWEITSGKKYLSPVIKDMLGYEDHELPNDPDTWIGLILKEDQQDVIASYQKHVASKGAYPYEVRARFRHKNGSVVHILSKGKITDWDYMGNPLRMIGYDTDVTGIVKEYKVLEERHEQYKTVIDIMNAGIWSYDVHKGRQYWSDNFYNAIGYRTNEIAPTYFNLLHVLAHPEDNGKLVNAINDHVKNKQPYALNIRLQNKEGVYNWYETSGKMAYNDEDKPARITGYILKRDEQTAAANAHADCSHPSGVFEYDLDRAKFSFSKEVIDILQLTEDSPLRFEPVNNLLTEPSRQIFQDGFNKAVYTREPYDIILTCITPKGNVKILREKAKPVTDEANKVIALKGTIQELQSRKATQAELSEPVGTQVADQNKRLLNFAHIASHNLRSHASNLQMILQVFNSSQNEEERKFCLDSLDKISQSLSKSISNLNDLMLIETELNISRVALTFKDVLNIVTGTLSQQINETKAVIESDFAKAPAIDYVPAYLESIMLNLVSNAIRYRNPQREPHIQLRTFTENGRKILTIQDNGMGIDLTKHKDKLFRMHQTFHNHPDSRGIGLLITKNQVEAMGGSIQVESEPGVGTTFTIKF